MELVCIVLYAVVAIMLFLAVLLLIHHKWKHSDPTDTNTYLPDNCDQWFQYSDVCNWHSCSHEMWVLFALLVAIVCIIFVSLLCVS